MGNKKTSLAMRIFLIVLAALMVIGMATATVGFIVDGIKSAIEENDKDGTGEDYSPEDGHEHEDEDGGKNY